MSDWGVRHGLASKLLPRPSDASPPPGVVRIDERYGGDLFDFERTRRLVREVYTYRGLNERDIWADRSTLNIPWHFYVLHVQLANAAMQTGEAEQGELVQGLLEEAETFLEAARGGRLGIPGE